MLSDLDLIRWFSKDRPSVACGSIKKKTKTKKQTFAIMGSKLSSSQNETAEMNLFTLGAVPDNICRYAYTLNEDSKHGEWKHNFSIFVAGFKM